MAMNAFGRCAGNSFSEMLVPAISPRVARMLPSNPAIWMVGGRFGTASDWIGGRCAPTQMITPIAPITAQRPSTALQ